MASSERTQHQLQQDLEHQQQALLTSLKQAIAANECWHEHAETPEMNELLSMAKSTHEPSLCELATKLEKVDAAVCTLKMGMYGLCADCEEAIEPEDLLTDPTQARCRSCRAHSRYHHDHN